MTKFCDDHEWVGEGECPHCESVYNALYRNKPRVLPPKADAPPKAASSWADALRQRSLMGTSAEAAAAWRLLLERMHERADKGLYTLPANKGLNFAEERFRDELIAKLQAEGFSVSTSGGISWSPEPNEPQPAMTWLEKLTLKFLGRRHEN